MFAKIVKATTLFLLISRTLNLACPSNPSNFSILLSFRFSCCRLDTLMAPMSAILFLLRLSTLRFLKFSSLLRAFKSLTELDSKFSLSKYGSWDTLLLELTYCKIDNVIKWKVNRLYLFKVVDYVSHLVDVFFLIIQIILEGSVRYTKSQSNQVLVSNCSDFKKSALLSLPFLPCFLLFFLKL